MSKLPATAAPMEGVYVAVPSKQWGSLAIPKLEAFRLGIRISATHDHTYNSICDDHH